MLPRQIDVVRDFPTPTVAEWRALVDADLKGAPFERKLITHTYEGILVQPLYTSGDWPWAGEPSGLSGCAPFTRGATPLGGALRGWDIRQEHSHPDAAALNSAILEDLANGVTSIQLRLDAATRLGLDPSAERAARLCGVDGAALPTAPQWDRAFEGVYLGMIGVGLEAGSAFTESAAQLAALWARRGIEASAARGAFNADPLGVLAREGSLPYDLPTGLARAADLAAWTEREYPGVTAIRVGTAAYHHAGATATQDIALSLATGLEYLRAMASAGIAPERAAGQMVFSFAIGTSFFLAIAKLRAARTLWSRVLGACGVAEPSRRMRLHVRTSKRVLTSHDPWVNILRNAACVFAGGVAGADVVTSVPFDAAIGLASAHARRIARNTQLILQEESHLHRVNDPAGGSWYIEHLTEDICEKAWIILQAIESRGGMAQSLIDGWIGEQIDRAFEPRAKNLATRKDVLTGVSEFADLGERSPERDVIDLVALRARLMSEPGGESTAEATPAPAPRAGEFAAWAADAAKAGVSIGQMSAARAPTTPVECEQIAVHPFAEPFERLRDASDRHLAECGARPRVFLASMGPRAEHGARSAYATGFFRAGGFEVISTEGFVGVPEAIRAFGESGASIAAICSTDARYTTLVPELAPALHAAGAGSVILAGNPAEREAEYRAAGVDRFIFVRCDVVAVLSELLRQEGAL
jgi:methylmalonyl-CoA mutase